MGTATCKKTAAWPSDEQHRTQIFSLILHFSISQHRNSYIGICSAYITKVHTEEPFFSVFWGRFTCWKLKWNPRLHLADCSSSAHISENKMVPWIQGIVILIRPRAGKDLDGKSWHFSSVNTARETSASNISHIVCVLAPLWIVFRRKQETTLGSGNLTKI